MAMFGEIVYESSRAFADDEEEELESQAGLSFEIEHTSVGKNFLQKHDSLATDLVFCAFDGKVALGFGDSFVGNERDFEKLAEVFMVGQGENVVDMYLNRPKKKPVARIYHGINEKNVPVIFALFNTYGVPRHMARDVVESVSPYVNISKRLLILHSETMAYYHSDESSNGKVFSVTNSKYLEKNKQPRSSQPLPPPNVIGGISAVLLMEGEMNDKPALLLAAYGETEFVDSISVRPFSSIIRENMDSDLGKIFSQFEAMDKLKLKANLSPVAISNLYV